MIYFPDKHMVIITPPHTASRSVHKALCSPKHKGVWINGPTYHKVIDHHYARTDGIRGVVTHGNKELPDCELEVHVVVRNPYDRLIGLYLHHQWYMNTKKGQDISWEDYVNYNITEEPYKFDPQVYWIHKKTISDLLRDNKISHDYPVFPQEYGLIRYEQLKTDLSRLLECQVDVGLAYHDANTPEEWYPSGELRNNVTKNWALEDCTAFGYEVLS